MPAIPPRGPRPRGSRSVRLLLIGLALPVTLAGCIPPPSGVVGSAPSAGPVPAVAPSGPAPMLGTSSTGIVHASVVQTAQLLRDPQVPAAGGLTMQAEVVVDAVPDLVRAGSDVRITATESSTIPTVRYRSGGSYTCSGNDRAALGWGAPFGVEFGAYPPPTVPQLALYRIGSAISAASGLPQGVPAVVVAGLPVVAVAPSRTVAADGCSETVAASAGDQFSVPAGTPPGRYLASPWDPLTVSGFTTVRGRSMALPAAAVGGRISGTLPVVTVEELGPGSPGSPSAGSTSA